MFRDPWGPGTRLRRGPELKQAGRGARMRCGRLSFHCAVVERSEGGRCSRALSGAVRAPREPWWVTAIACFPCFHPVFLSLLLFPPPPASPSCQGRGASPTWGLPLLAATSSPLPVPAKTRRELVCGGFVRCVAFCLEPPLCVYARAGGRARALCLQRVCVLYRKTKPG